MQDEYLLRNGPLGGHGWHYLALIGTVGLLTSKFCQLIWFAPSQIMPISLALLFWCTPLLLPLRGLLKAKPYTHAWANYVSLWYFLHGVDVAFNSASERYWGLLDIALSLAMFLGCTYYAKIGGKALNMARKESSQTGISGE